MILGKIGFRRGCQIGLFAFLSLVGWQHLTRHHSNMVRPSDLINGLIDHMGPVFEWIGRQFALISSFYCRLHLLEIGQSFLEVTQPLIKLTLVPLTSFNRGYQTYVSLLRVQYGNFLVNCGGLTLGLALFYGIYRYCLYRYPNQMKEFFDCFNSKEPVRHSNRIDQENLLVEMSSAPKRRKHQHSL